MREYAVFQAVTFYEEAAFVNPKIGCLGLFLNRRELHISSPCIPGEGRRVAKAMSGGTTHTCSGAESAERSGGLQRSEGWGMTCLREEAAPP